MRVFVAGGTGVIGRRLVPQLIARGHQVTATTTSAAGLGLLEQLGAEGVVMDGLDASSVGEAVASARPDAIAHQMTAIGSEMDLVHMDRWFATTNRLRTEGTDHLLAAAEASGVSNFVAQSYAGWNGIREGGWVKTEEDPLDLWEGTVAHPVMAAIDHVEDVVVRRGARHCGSVGSTGRGPPTAWPKPYACSTSPSSATAAATPPGCTSTTQRARQSSPSSSRRRACSTSSTTSRHR